MKNIALLGATGSIGTQVLDVVRENPDKFRIRAMTAGRNMELFALQLQEFCPAFAAVAEENAARALAESFPDIQFSWGMEGLCAAASAEGVGMTVNGLMGMIGLQPTLAAVEAGKDVALANKETLVAGGEIVMDAVRRAGIRFLPVDSEHSAIFQCLQNQALPERLILTASGGPFRGYTKEQLKAVTKEQDEVYRELERDIKQLKEPLFLAALLNRTANERENSNRILKNILAKLEGLERRVESIEKNRGMPAPKGPRHPEDIILPEPDENIMAFVREHKKACAEDIQKAFGYKGKNAASSRLNRLFELGLLEKRQAGRKVYYVTSSENQM